MKNSSEINIMSYFRLHLKGFTPYFIFDTEKGQIEKKLNQMEKSIVIYGKKTKFVNF